MMKLFSYLLAIMVLAACNASSTQNNNREALGQSTDTSANFAPAVSDSNLITEDKTESETATYYVVIADTGLDYFLLRKKMIEIKKSLHLTIDTMGRHYNKAKNLIALPENDNDELYAGDYYPRRFPSVHMSLEYMDFYQHKATEKTIALVTGIYESEIAADSALISLNQLENKAFKIKADIYIGCLH